MSHVIGVPLVFIDTETTGLNTFTDHIWEIGGIRRDNHGDRQFHWFVEHDTTKAASLPPRYFTDYRQRFDPAAAASAAETAHRLVGLCAGRAVMVGANVSFDMHLIERLLRGHGHDRMPWDHHPLDIEAYAVGHLADRHVQAPWASDDLAERCGVIMRDEHGDPRYRRHTALDDARWVRDWYDTIRTAVNRAADRTAQPQS